MEGWRDYQIVRRTILLPGGVYTVSTAICRRYDTISVFSIQTQTDLS